MNTIIEKIRAEIKHRRDLNYKYYVKQGIGSSAEYRYDEDIEILSILFFLEQECEKPTNIDFEQELYKHFGQVKDFTLGMQIGKHFYELGKQSKQPVCEGFDGLTPEEKMNHPLYLEGFEVGRKVGLVLAEKTTIPAEVLEEEIKRYYSDNFAYLSSDQPTLSILTNVARHFYELGCRDTVECYKERSEELVCEGLDGEITEFIANNYEVDYNEGLKHLGEYLDTYDVEEIARHFAQWQKEQMMKEAVEGEVVKDINNKLAVTAKNVNLDKFRFGERVKIIIVNED